MTSPLVHATLAPWLDIARERIGEDTRGRALLAAQQASLARARPARQWRAASANVARRDTPPALRILHVASWSPALGPDARVFLQGWGDDLYVRIQGTRQPDRLRLISGTAEGATRLASLEPTPMCRRFALPYLNGGGEDGQLWYAPDLAAPIAFDARWVSLEVHRGGSVSRTARYALDATGAVEVRRVQRALFDLIAAYTEDNAGTFRAALEPLTRTAGRWRALSPIQNLWLSAMVAELIRTGRAERFGCSALGGHPQLLT